LRQTLVACLAAASLAAAAPAFAQGASAPRATAAPAPLTQAQLLALGQRQFLQCRACHTLKPGEAHRTGPNLNGVFGAKAGTRPGYTYSAVLAGANVVWNDDTLDHWLQNPTTFLKGNRMAFAGVPDAQRRAALIAYLRAETR
jgi:cytochrome c